MVESHYIDKITLATTSVYDGLSETLGRLVSVHNALAESTVENSAKAFKRMQQLEARQKELFAGQDAKVSAQLERLGAAERRAEAFERSCLERAQASEASLSEATNSLRLGQEALRASLEDVAGQTEGIQAQHCAHTRADLSGRRAGEAQHRSVVTTEPSAGGVALEKRVKQALVGAMEAQTTGLRRRLGELKDELDSRLGGLLEELRARTDAAVMQGGRLATLEDASERHSLGLDKMSADLQERVLRSSLQEFAAGLTARVDSLEADGKDAHCSLRDGSRATAEGALHVAELAERLEESERQRADFVRWSEARLDGLQADVKYATDATAALSAPHRRQMALRAEVLRAGAGGRRDDRAGGAADDGDDDEYTQIPASLADVRRLVTQLECLERRQDRSDADIGKLARLARYMDARVETLPGMERRMDDLSQDCGKVLKSQTALSTKCLSCGKGGEAPSSRSPSCLDLPASRSPSCLALTDFLSMPGSARASPAPSRPTSAATARSPSPPAQRSGHGGIVGVGGCVGAPTGLRPERPSSAGRALADTAGWVEAGWAPFTAVPPSAVTVAPPPAPPARPARPASAPSARPGGPSCRPRPQSARCRAEAAQDPPSLWVSVTAGPGNSPAVVVPSAGGGVGVREAPGAASAAKGPVAPQVLAPCRHGGPIGGIPRPGGRPSHQLQRRLGSR